MIKTILFNVILVVLIGYLSPSCMAQTDTTFWFAAPEVINAHGDRPIYLRVASLDQSAVVTVSQPANNAFSAITVNLAANSSQSIDLTSFIDIIEDKPANQVLNFGILIRSTTKITAYYEVNSPINPEIFALKGRNALGTEFYTPFQNFTDNVQGYSSFEIVATEDNTTVQITPSKPIVGHVANVTYSVTLNKGQTYSATALSQAANQHLGGSHITSNKPIAVTVKDDSISGSNWVGCKDLAGDQIVPVNNIGSKYIVMKGFLTGGVEKVFILAVSDNTQIFINGNPTAIATINRTETFSCDITQKSTYFETSKPVYFQHMSGFGCELGVPLLPSIECTGSQQVGFVRSSSEFFGINLMTKNGNQGNFVLNNTTTIPASAFEPVPGTNNEWVTAQLSFTTSQIPVETGMIIKNTTSVFHFGMINGGSSTGCRYGYFSAFSRFKPAIQFKNSCINELTQFQLSDINLLSSVAWDFGDPASPQNTSTETNPTHLFSKTGLFTVRAIYDYPCGKDTVYQSITIGTIPNHIVNKNISTCAGIITINGGDAGYTYLWSTNQTQQSVTVNAPGTYWVKMTNQSDCSITDTIKVVQLPTARLTNSNTIKTIYSGENTDISLTSNLSGTTYNWEAKASTPLITGYSAGSGSSINQVLLNPGTETQAVTYSVTTHNTICVGDPVNFVVNVLDEDSVLISIPNTFTPNKDEFNDTFGPYTRGIMSVEMNITDRNGRFIAKIDQVNGSWDGNMPSGGAAPQGVYYYNIDLFGFNNKKYNRHGNVNLYRDRFSLSPNPAKSSVLINLNNNFDGEKTITLYNTQGLVIRIFKTNEDILNMDVGNLPKGLYILKVADSFNSSEIKFYKE